MCTVPVISTSVSGLCRPFCPWQRRDAEQQNRCGWQWGLDVLVPSEQGSASSLFSSRSQVQPQDLLVLLGILWPLEGWCETHGVSRL